MKKRILYGVAALFVFLLATNPSLNDFKDNNHTECYKTANYILFSVFVENINDESGGRQNVYIGISKNFFLLDGSGPYKSTVREFK